jgi:hypothetical protein
MQILLKQAEQTNEDLISTLAATELATQKIKTENELLSADVTSLSVEKSRYKQKAEKNSMTNRLVPYAKPGGLDDNTQLIKAQNHKLKQEIMQLKGALLEVEGDKDKLQDEVFNLQSLISKNKLSDSLQTQLESEKELLIMKLRELGTKYKNKSIYHRVIQLFGITTDIDSNFETQLNTNLNALLSDINERQKQSYVLSAQDVDSLVKLDNKTCHETIVAKCKSLKGNSLVATNFILDVLGLPINMRDSTTSPIDPINKFLTICQIFPTLKTSAQRVALSLKILTILKAQHPNITKIFFYQMTNHQPRKRLLPVDTTVHPNVDEVIKRRKKSRVTTSVLKIVQNYFMSPVLHDNSGPKNHIPTFDNTTTTVSTTQMNSNNNNNMSLLPRFNNDTGSDLPSLTTSLPPPSNSHDLSLLSLGGTQPNLCLMPQIPNIYNNTTYIMGMPPNLSLDNILNNSLTNPLICASAAQNTLVNLTPLNNIPNQNMNPLMLESSSMKRETPALTYNQPNMLTYNPTDINSLSQPQTLPIICSENHTPPIPMSNNNNNNHVNMADNIDVISLNPPPLPMIHFQATKEQKWEQDIMAETKLHMMALPNLSMIAKTKVNGSDSHKTLPTVSISMPTSNIPKWSIILLPGYDHYITLASPEHLYMICFSCQRLLQLVKDIPQSDRKCPNFIQLLEAHLYLAQVVLASRNYYPTSIPDLLKRSGLPIEIESNNVMRSYGLTSNHTLWTSNNWRSFLSSLLEINIGFLNTPYTDDDHQKILHLFQTSALNKQGKTLSKNSLQLDLVIESATSCTFELYVSVLENKPQVIILTPATRVETKIVLPFNGALNVSHLSRLLTWATASHFLTVLPLEVGGKKITSRCDKFHLLNSLLNKSVINFELPFGCNLVMRVFNVSVK